MVGCGPCEERGEMPLEGAELVCGDCCVGDCWAYAGKEVCCGVEDGV